MRRMLLLALLPLALTNVFGERYVSDAVGIVGEPIGADDTEEHEYVMEITTADGVETRRLFRNDEEVSRTTIERTGTSTTEVDYDGELVAARRVMDATGNLTTEQLYTNGELAETRWYDYRDGVLRQRTITDAAGEQVRSETYRYWGDGELRSIVRDDGRITEYRYADGRLDEEWNSVGDTVERYRFDTAGRLVRYWSWEADELTAEEVRTYWTGDPDAPLQSVREEKPGSVTTSEYDARGRLERSTTTEDDVVVTERRLTYDGDDLVLESERDHGVTRAWSYEYADGELDRTNYSEGNQLVEVTIHHPDDPAYDEVREVYRNGAVALRVYSVDGRRVKEEVIRDGEVIHTRLFDTTDEEGE